MIFMKQIMQLFFCPRKDVVVGHDKVKTVWFNHKSGLFECLDKQCKGRFIKTEMGKFNKGLPSKYPKIHCPICGSEDIAYIGYGGVHPRFKCKESGHIFT